MHGTDSKLRSFALQAQFFAILLLVGGCRDRSQRSIVGVDAEHAIDLWQENDVRDARISQMMESCDAGVVDDCSSLVVASIGRGWLRFEALEPETAGLIRRLCARGMEPSCNVEREIRGSTGEAETALLLMRALAAACSEQVEPECALLGEWMLTHPNESFRGEARLVDALEVECESGAGIYCAALADLQLARGSMDEALTLYATACASDVGRGCRVTGFAAHVSDANSLDRHADRWGHACGLGDTSSCELAAQAHAFGLRAEVDLRQAAMMLDLSCMSGHAAACGGTPQLMSEVPREQWRAGTPHPRSREGLCRDDAPACTRDAIVDYLHDQDPIPLLARLEDACRAHFGPACAVLAAEIRFRDLPLPTEPTVAEACELGSFSGCMGLDDAARRSQGLRRACDAGYELACALGQPDVEALRTIAVGADRLRDTSRASVTSRCEGDDAVACRELGAQLTSGTLSPRDLRVGARALGNACAMADVDACYFLAQLELRVPTASAALLRQGRVRLLRACADGQPYACLDRWFRGWGSRNDLQVACTGGSLLACSELRR
jgi:TPR repeat protein